LWSTKQRDRSFHEKTDHISAGTGEVKESKWEELANPIEADEEYNCGGDEEEF